jgi:Fur family transcriptional regulator, ferric uptake regulator
VPAPERARLDRVARSRTTRQGAAVEGLLVDSEGFRSAQDLHAELRRRGDGIGLTTVYRHLQTLVERGRVDMLRTEDGEALYRRCGTQHHHHHLVCRSCGRAEEVEGQAVERWALRVADEHGFTDVDHTVEVLGTCASCAAGDSPDPVR